MRQKVEIVKTGFNVYEIRENGITIAERPTREEAQELVRKSQVKILMQEAPEGF